MGRATQGALWPLLGLAALFYIAQPVRIGPNPVDEGLLVSVLDALSGGERLHHDLLDVYGPAHWTPLRWVYRALGERVLGARLYLLALKALGLGLSVWLVNRLSGRFHALLSGLWLTLLLGVPWQLLQAPYPFLQAWVLALCVGHLLLFERGLRWAPLWAGAACGLAMATKLNAGLFLLAGGLFVLTYGLRQVDGGPGPRLRASRPLALFGLALFGGVFAFATAKQMHRWLALYVLLPLAVPLAWTALWQARPGRDSDDAGDLGGAILFGLSALVTVCVVFALSFGAAGAIDYAATFATLVAQLNYTAPLPPIGEPGPFVGFNEHYWPQLIWLATALAAAVALAARPGTGAARSARPLLGLFALCATHFFVLYARLDESHIYQATLPAVPALFACAAWLARRLHGRARLGYHAGLATIAVAALPSLFVPPSLALFEARPSPWHSPHLHGIDFRPSHNPHVLAAFFHDRREIDERTNAAAAWLDAEADDGAQVLVLTREELLPLNANLRAVGGRHRYLFYLLKNGFIDRTGFDRLAPPELLPRLLSHPPPWIVDEPFRSPILDALPELDAVLKTRYVRLQTFGHVWIYRRVK